MSMQLRAEVLTRQEIMEIDKATVQVLSEVGISIASHDTCKLLETAGAQVDHRTELVKIPEDLLRKSIRSATETPLDLFDRHASSFVRLEGKRTFNVSGFDATYTLDFESGVRRPATKSDVGQFAKLADALPNIHVVGTEAIPQDVQQRSAELHAVEAILDNTVKHCLFAPSDGEVARAVLEMVRVACGRRDISTKPPMTSQVSPTSPLRWEKNAIEALLESTSAGVPLHVISQPIAGITAPMSLAGVLLLQNVEILTGVVMAQLVKPGTHVIYGFVPTILDMREASSIIASPEGTIMRVASAQVAKYYGLPCLSAGPDSDAHVHDEQTAWEKAITGFAIYLGGADLMLNPGMFSSGMIASFEQLVIDNEILGYLERTVRGMQVNEETLVVDLIRRVGCGGQFLKQPHTLKHFRSELWMPDISCRSTFGRWMSKGGRDILQSAKEKARGIIRDYHAQAIDPDINAELKEIVRNFEEKHPS
jgi:trimethylamine--corrinoid protein Co-methyltransferase